ncbi:hypothetical protein LZ31DRAFT_121582 [Colletotrichum somersetense]|nr:hypothetical protein LZ31DRAFT_121582 [Colletotrichum somersetense]
MNGWTGPQRILPDIGTWPSAREGCHWGRRHTWSSYWEEEGGVGIRGGDDVSEVPWGMGKETGSDIFVTMTAADIPGMNNTPRRKAQAEGGRRERRRRNPLVTRLGVSFKQAEVQRGSKSWSRASMTTGGVFTPTIPPLVAPFAIRACDGSNHGRS